jgi:hypothetical protein
VSRFNLWGDAEVKNSQLMVYWFKYVGGTRRQIHDPNIEMRWGGLRPELIVIMLPRKTSMIVALQSVPQSATGRRGEYPKVLGLTHVKELGKLTP